MRMKSPFFLIFLITLMFSFNASLVQAKSKSGILGLGQSHLEDLDYKPFIMPPTQPHNRQWDFKKWEPEDWKKGTDGESLIQGFFEADILRRQTTNDKIPVLVVGENFYNLSGYDKRRVTDLLDDIYNITQGEAGHYKIKDPFTGDVIGYYDQYGLRLR